MKMETEFRKTKIPLVTENKDTFLEMFEMKFYWNFFRHSINLGLMVYFLFNLFTSIFLISFKTELPLPI